METKTSKHKVPAISPTIAKRSAIAIAIVGIAVTAFAFRDEWLPKANQLFASVSKSGDDVKPGTDDGGHEGHAHGHEGHDESNSIELSPQARKNIGLETAEIELQTYVRSASMPATIVARPGRSHAKVTAPMGGRVTRIYAVEGEAVDPGQPLFDLRLTHEELVTAQSNFLRMAEELDVELREIKRLDAAGNAIAGKKLRLREYEKQKLEASLNAHTQSLLLHGLTQPQINGILQSRKLVQGITVRAPEHQKNGEIVAEKHPFTVHSLDVKPGQYVDAGASLCGLIDYQDLYIEGRAFEHDADELVEVARGNWELTAVVEDDQDKPETIDGLKIVFVGNEVEPESRALHFYVGLSNTVVHESRSPEGHRFLTWKYKPGQRMQIRVPVERWQNRIVLPVDGVAQEGVEHYVFQQNGDHFDRVPVQVEYQDQFSTVVANDGSLFPGDIVAISGAHQLQMALKNKAGGAVDPHAGHNH